MTLSQLESKLALASDCAAQARQWIAAGPSFVEQALQRIRKAEKRLFEARIELSRILLARDLDQVPPQLAEDGAHIDAEVVPNGRGGWGIRLFRDELILGNYPTDDDALRIACGQFQSVRVLPEPVGPSLATRRPKHPSSSSNPNPLPLTSPSLTSSSAHA